MTITTDGDPVLRRNHVHHNREAGANVHDEGLGTFEDNDVTGNAEAGFDIRRAGNPTVRGNRINRNAHQAIYVHEGERASSRTTT